MPIDFTAIGTLPLSSWILAAGAVLVIGIAKSGFGGGVGILAVPMFVAAMGPKVGLGAMLPLLVAADCLSVYHHWGTWDWHNLRVLVPGTLVGLTLGAILLAWMLGPTHLDQPNHGASTLDGAETSMRVGIGIVCIAYVLADLIRKSYAGNWRWTANRLSGTFAGILAGVTSTLAHAAGPVIAIFFLGQHLSKKPFIGTTVVYFLIVNTIKLVPYALLHMIDPSTLGYGLLLLPLVPVGTYIGAHLNRILNEVLFRSIIMLLVFLTGLRMVLA